jgi:hypothetical protein
MTGLAARGNDLRGPLAALRSPRRRPGRWSTPARIKTRAATVLALAGCLAVLAGVLLGQVRGEFQAMGERDAPEADAMTGLYFALNDMDAQVANVLLTGGGTALAASRSQDLKTYTSDRTAADRDLEQATVSEAGNESAERELALVLDRMGQYEALAADALLAGGQAHSAAGRPPAAAVAYYQQATGLMQAGILPAVGSLTTVSAASLDTAYRDGATATGTGAAGLAALGGLLAVVLIALQFHLAVRFRRLVNPALAAATVLAVAFTAVAAARLGAESGQLRVAKQDAFDSIQALTLARAVSYDANADESRYLVDPGRAAQHQQAFLTKSQQIVNVGPVGISGYDAALAADIKAYQRDNSQVRFGGYLGAEFRNITFPGERQAALAALLSFQRYEKDDRTLRALAAKSLTAAVGYDTGTAPGQSDWAFNQYDAALSGVIAVNSAAFTSAVHDGEGGGTGWELVFPGLGLVLVAALTVAGVRPRLAEYRP